MTTTGERSETVRRLGRVPAFDGVRAVAVLLVVWSHIGIVRAVPKSLKPLGGFLGVDVFFVLSGFLITALLLDEQAYRGRLRFGAFYRRRALRLFPVILAFLVAHVVFTQLVIHGSPETERSSIPAALFFFTNWWAIHNPIPLAFGHFWSLAVEEQFYLVWPFVTVLLTVRARCKTVVWVLGSTIVLVALHRAVMWDNGASWGRLVLGTDTHADGLLVGALLAHLWVRARTPRRGVALAASVSAVFVVVSTAVFDVQSAFLYLGGYTVFAVAVAIVLLAILDTEWVGSRFLSLAPLRAVGRVSYGLYVWHPLVFFWVWYETQTWNSKARLAAALLVTAAVVSLSWVFIEQPFLRWKDRLERAEAPAGQTRRATAAARGRS